MYVAIVIAVITQFLNMINANLDIYAPLYGLLTMILRNAQGLYMDHFGNQEYLLKKPETLLIRLQIYQRGRTINEPWITEK